MEKGEHEKKKDTSARHDGLSNSLTRYLLRFKGLGMHVTTKLSVRGIGFWGLCNIFYLRLPVTSTN